MSSIKKEPSSTWNLVEGEVVPIPTLLGTLRFDITNELVNKFEIVVLDNTLKPATPREPVHTEAVFNVENDILSELRDTIFALTEFIFTSLFLDSSYVILQRQYHWKHQVSQASYSWSVLY